MAVETNRRTYAIKLVSTQRSWMPLIAFNYPDDMQRQWSAYQQNVAWGAASSTLPTGENSRWSPSAGQFGGFAKLGSGSYQAANCSASFPPAPIAAYASSGVSPPSDECGRRVL